MWTQTHMLHISYNQITKKLIIMLTTRRVSRTTKTEQMMVKTETVYQCC